MAFALQILRAPINLTSSLMGHCSATCSSAAFERVQISESLQGIMAAAPGADRSRVILYFHGGGHWLLTASTYKEFIGRLSAATQAVVIAVDYSKPPAVQFPAGLNEALAAWHWARDRFGEGSVAVAGDSSGANLAFALVVKLAQLEEEQPVACIGISPWLRLDLKTSLPNLYGKFCADLYLGGWHKVTKAADPLVTIVNASPELVRCFPPILMHAGSNELTTEDVKAMAVLCESVGSPAEVQFYGCPHIFQVGPGFHKSTRDSLQRIDAFLQKQWKSAPTE